MAQLFDPGTINLATFPARLRAGLSTLLPMLAADRSIERLTWAAYMLATAQWETARTYEPVAEAGNGAGKPYGVPVPVVMPDGSIAQNTFYGRGYVQLTWQSNYIRIGVALGLGRTLEQYPDRALQPDIAYRIFSQGMVRGWFTGVGLSRYLTAGTTDYVSARRIINGTDHAEDIAAMAVAWQRRLQR